MHGADHIGEKAALGSSGTWNRATSSVGPLLLCGGLTFGAVKPTVAVAQDPLAVEAQAGYTVRQWTVRNGLPSNTISDILRASDGYLWLATIEGVVRFDGRRFTVFNATNTPALPSNRIFQIAEGPPGHLWIRSAPNALTHYHAGAFTRVAIPGDSSGVQRIVYSEPTTVWVATRDGLARYEDGRMRPFRPDGIERGATDVVRDDAGRLWIGTSEGAIYRVDVDGTVHRIAIEEGAPRAPVTNLMMDGQRTLWASLRGGLLHIAGDRAESVGNARGAWSDLTDLQLIDAAGAVWVSADPQGWWRFDSSGTGTLTAAMPGVTRLGEAALAPDGAVWRGEQRETREQRGSPGMTATLLREDEPILRVASRVGEVVFDPSGVVWVATGGSGLLQLRPSPLRVIGTADGLPNGNVYPILQDKDGQFWIGTFGDGVVRLGSDPFRPAVDEGGGFTLSLYQDRDGSIWVGRFGPTCRIVRARCVVIDLPALGEAANGVRVMHEDRQGRLWLGGNNGLAMGRGAPGARTWERIISSDSLPAHPVRTILELRDGEILFGTQGDGVLRYASDGRFEVFGTEQGLPSGNVRDLHEDATGYVWIALEDRGLCRLDRHGSSALGQAALACVDTRAGLYHDGLHRLLEDAQGRFWFNTNNGIFHVDKSALNAYLDGAIPAISSIGYTEADGMLHREGNGGMQPAGIKARNGDLWFPTRNGVVVVDPSAIPVPDPPYVALEQVRVAGTTRAVAETLALRTVRDFTVQYTALEFRHPDAVRFQYRLTGYDGEWQYAADARTTTYTNLAPGAYVFEVRAKSGLRWGEPARMIVTRSGFMYEQTWFFAAMSLLVLGTGYLAYRARMRRIAAHNAHLEQVVAARTAELRSKTEELQHANSLKSRFLANITHEFRTPLTLTFGPIDDLLSGRFTLDEAARPHLERARSNGRRLLRLINQLLDLSRLDANALELHPERHDLANHLRQLAALFSTLAAERQMQLIVQLPERARDHVYDADVLERVVLNLLSNAFKFTKPGGKVSLVLAYDDNGTARIEVVDTGPGIPEEHIPHLFDRFYQVESATTRAHEGSGIGLALVKELVELHGGDIAVASTVGFGTSFTVRLPSREAQTSAARAPARDATANRERGSTGMYRVSLPNLDIDSQVIARADRAAEAPIVMVVEDNADMRAYIRSHLEDDFDLIEAANGRDAFALATEQVPDLVLSDVMMPDIDGLQLCAMLKADEKTSHIPILLLTARSQVEDRIQGFESGADGYLSKPFNGEELRVRVRTLVEERRRLRARFGAMTTVTERDSVNDARESAAPPTLPPREAEFLEKVRKAIDEQLSDSQFGVDRLAEEMFMSPRQLYRKVEAVTGETPAGFIRARRMQRAKALLSTGRYSVKEVAYQVGFKSRPSFSAAYRQAYGVSPSDRGTGGRE